MDKKEKSKFLRRFFGRVGLKFFSFTLAKAPLWFLYMIANVFAFCGYIFAGKQRKIAKDNLKLAFGNEKTPREIKDLIKSNFVYIAKSGVETIALINNPKLLLKKVKLSGKENLQSALSKGKGVVIVTGHFGNFPVMVTRFALEGYKTNLVLRHLRDEKVDEILLEKRNRLGITSIYNKPRIECVNKCLEALRRNGLVVMQIDQNFGSGSGVFVDFFGQKAATPTGPVIFALRAKASIVPVFIVRQPNNEHIVIIEKEFDIEEKISYDNTIQYNIERLTKIIESYIRRYPEEWSWIHKRWKTKPRTADNAE
jgi:KDO2-lipid IV(A) lauroyltransferase